MALTKVQADGINLGDTFAFTGTVSGTSVAGSNAFAARNSATVWSTASGGSLIQFNDDSGGDCFDTDSCYDTSTYKFTAPATGVYTFWYSIYTANSDAEIKELQSQDIEWEKGKSDRELIQLRKQRNNLLAETDWMANSDVTMSTAWKNYRQALRDITKTYKSMDDEGFKFPEKPTE